MKASKWRRPLVVGASGQVGAELCRVLTEGGSGAPLRSGRTPQAGWLNLDLAEVRKPEDAAALLDAAAPDLILCAGAMTFVDGCEERRDEAFQANAYGPSMLAAYAHRRDAPFVYFSSDYVFDGTPGHPGPYRESDAVHPLSAYGQSKLEGERSVTRVHPGALIVRTSWVYGPDAAGKNFITSLVRQLRAGQPVRVPWDQVSTPTLNRDLAQITLGLVEKGISGIVHVTGPELVSRYDLARAVAEFFALDETLVESVSTASLGQRAKRPLLSGLISDRLRNVETALSPRTLHEGLDTMRAGLAV